MTRRQVHRRWAIALTIFWACMNWPTTSGLGGIWASVGFPIPFAWGTFGRFQGFDMVAFMADLLLSIAVIAGVPWLCAWSRKLTDNESVNG